MGAHFGRRAPAASGAKWRRPAQPLIQSGAGILMDALKSVRSRQHAASAAP